MSKPEFVGVVRQVIPQEGIQTDKPARLKSKIKKALDKARIQSETIRGVGRRLGEYALVYTEKEGKLFANFQKYNALQIKQSSKRRGKSKSKSTQPILTGKHPQCLDHTPKTFALAIIEALPEDWEKVDATTYRWISTDAGFLLNTQHTVESAAEHFLNQASGLLPAVKKYYYTLIFINGHYVIGIGPA